MGKVESSYRVARFEGFEFDLRSGELCRDGDRPVSLAEQPFTILAMLLEHSGDLVTREEIRDALWPNGTIVEFEHSISAAINRLRQVLGDSAEESRYIETLARRGYRWRVGVEWVGRTREAAQQAKLAVGAETQTSFNRSLVDRKASPYRGLEVLAGGAMGVEHEPNDRTASLGAEVMQGPEAETAPSPISRPKAVVVTRRVLIALASCAILALVVTLARPVVPAARVKGVHQITHIGTIVSNHNLVVSGSRLYFDASERGDVQIRYVSLDNNNAVSAAEIPIPKIEIVDIAPSGKELLVVKIVQGFPLGFWTRTLLRMPLPSGTPQRVGNIYVGDASWSPDGRTIVYTDENEQTLNLVDAGGGNPRKLVSLPGRPFKPRWSPDGKLIRASVLDPKGGGVSLWQLDASGRNVARMFPGWSSSDRVWVGRWTGDGSYFLFTESQGGTRNIWALRDKRDILRRNGAQPVRLTDGPVDFNLPVASKDGKTIYAVGVQRHGQLMRYNARSGQYEPYANGLSIEHIDFSRDGQWMAYANYPEGALMRSRLDGSERLQLTFAPMRTGNVQWSPDGSQIAFDASLTPGGVPKIYLISANGGSPRLADSGRGSMQIMSGWSPDGQSLLFGSPDEADSHWEVYSLNLKTGKETLLPGTLGIFGGRLSPDGRVLAASSATTHSLVLYDLAAGTTRQLAELADYPCWSRDGKYIYYQTFAFYPVLGDKIAMYRARVSDGSIERVAPRPTFGLAGNWGPWSGLAPDDSILVLRELGTSDIYALDVDLP